MKTASRHIPFLLGLASSLLLTVALGQFSCIDSLTSTTKFSELEEFGDTVALGCALGGTKRKKEKKRKKSVHETYGSSTSSSLLACCCASESEGSGEGSRMRGWGLVRFLIIEVRLQRNPLADVKMDSTESEVKSKKKDWRSLIYVK